MIPLSLEPNDWPVIDQALWKEANAQSSFLVGHKRAAHWSKKRRRIVVQGYGQVLSFLKRNGKLDENLPPEQRVKPEIFDAFLQECKQRVAPWSLMMYAQGAYCALKVMAPQADLKWMGGIVARLKSMARSSRDKRSHMVAASQLFDLGVSLMETTNPDKVTPYQATRFRDGLMICVEICCPVRIGNLKQITLDEHLKKTETGYRLTFGKHETKTRTPYQSDLPTELEPYLERYLGLHRRILVARGKDGPTLALWVDRKGCPMSEAAIRAQVESRTQAAFGKHVWPHLFRSIASSGMAAEMPDQASLIPDVLGHSDFKTSQKYYILADGKLAHDRYQDSLAQRREEALARQKQARKAASAKLDI